MERAILEDRIDFGITYVPIPTAGVEHLKVGSVEMGVFAVRGVFSGVAIGEIPFAVPVEPVHGSPNKVQGLDGWPEDRIKRRAVYRVTLMETALELCRQRLAAAYLPTFVVNLHNRQHKPEFALTELSVPALPTARQPVYLIRRDGRAEDPVTRKLARALRALSAN
jgi:DNA-binding transcriptional LysR family regulator